MRRKDRQVNSFDEIVEILSRCDTIRLAMKGDPFPYVVPLSFGYDVFCGKVRVFIHGALDGMKHDLLSKDSCVCVEADSCLGFVDMGKDLTTEYESVIGFGTAQRVFGDDAVYALDRIVEHCGFPGYDYDRSIIGNMAIYRIELSEITGKRRKV